MKTFIQYLLEKRSNPDKNKKVNPIEQLFKYKDDTKNLYISYTSLKKIGINPRSRYNTPNGIYTYQLDYALPRILKSNTLTNVPYMGEQPYVWVIKPTAKVLVLTEYDNFQEDVEKIRNHFKDKIPNLEMMITNSTNHPHVRTNNKQASSIWDLTYNLAGNPNRWNYLLRNVLGYSIIRDDGMGLIHPSEPSQTVFLSKTSFTVVEKIINFRSGAHINLHSSDTSVNADNKMRLKHNTLDVHSSRILSMTQLKEYCEKLLKTESYDDYRKFYTEFKRLVWDDYIPMDVAIKYGVGVKNVSKLVNLCVRRKFNNILGVFMQNEKLANYIPEELSSTIAFSRLMEIIKDDYKSSGRILDDLEREHLSFKKITNDTQIEKFVKTLSNKLVQKDASASTTYYMLPITNNLPKMRKEMLNNKDFRSIIAKDPYYALSFAVDYLNSRFKESEPIIAKSGYYLSSYLERFPDAKDDIEKYRQHS